MEQIELVIVAFMICFNAVFAGYEIALASVSVARLRTLVDESRHGAKAALAMKEGIEKSLAVVQLGITLVGLIAGATGGASASDDISPYLQVMGMSETAANVVAICLVVFPLTIATIVIGELMPKLFALRNQEWVCLKLSPIMRLFSILAWPIVWLLEFSATGLMSLIEKVWRPKPHADARTEAAELQELRTIASMARASSLIGAREERIIHGAARIASRPLRDIVLPAEHIHMLRLEGSLTDSLIAAHLDLHTRFPVARDTSDPQTIVGYVTFKDIVSALKVNSKEPTVRGILRAIPKLSASISISEALECLLREHTHIALVRENDESVMGMITLEDIVEELVGDIQDEHDLLPVHVIRTGDGWIAGGGATLQRIREITGIAFDETDDSRNLNAWITERLTSPPSGSEIIQSSGLRVMVRKVRRQRVLEAIIHSKPSRVPNDTPTIDKRTLS